MLTIKINDVEANCFTLSFIDHYESEFLKDYSNKSVYHSRIALMLAMFFYGIFGILDAWLAPEEKISLWIIRYVIFIPYTLMVIFFTFSRRFKGLMQAANASVVLLAGVGIICMIMIAPANVSNSYYAGLILVFIFGYTFFKLRFIWATFTGWMIVIAYEITAVFISETPLPIMINNNFFFLAGNLLGMFACYSIEYYLRKEFIQSRMLEAEKLKVNAANLELEKNVAQRTSQLVVMNKNLEHEIQERKRNSEALKLSKERYQTILESMQEGYFETDLTGNIKFYNNSASKILGFSSQEMSDLNYREFTSKKTAKKMFQSFNNLYNSGKSVDVIDYSVARKDGQIRILSMSTSLIRDMKGNPTGFRGVARDETDRKQAEEKIRRMNDELEQRVMDRTAQLNKANLALKKSLSTVEKTQDRLVQTEKMASLGSLVAGVAHEINTPVGIGVTAASLLEDKTRQIYNLHDVGQMKRSDFEKYLKSAKDTSSTILSNLNRAADLIRSFKQVAVDQSNEEMRLFDVKGYIYNILNSLRPKIKKTKHHIQVECQEDLNINSYPGAFSQIITNLVMNSILHGFNGIESGLIQIKFSKNNKSYLLTYQDNGIGMEENTRLNIFEPFFTTKRASGGTGLGMHIVFNIATQTLKGSIRCESEPGNGTLVELKFPLN